MIFDLLSDGLPKGTSLSLICIDLKLLTLYLIRKQVRIVVNYSWV